ncbi:MAG: hypothetical protein JNK69_06300 [Saprospiraceae bacterium]|nr:hypothetical protein [Saprospiraceae bacterium]
MKGVMIETGIKELDIFWNNSLHKSKLILLVARPGMGKTSFLMSIGKLISQKHRTLIFSLEYAAKNLERINPNDSLVIDDTSQLDVQQLSEIIASKNAEVVLIDYIQLLGGNRVTLLQDLKKIAKNMNICLIVNSQIGREPEYRVMSERRPLISDLTGSTLFNLDNLSYIDNLTFMYRDQYYNPSTEKRDVIELIHYINDTATSVKLEWSILS